ncbi:FKBP-type peptidyl-prolyl cis-trans isomerase [uncultured Sunxiuqinia sp.]|uniref:FKBP-type peptidyl-prolyl cis-trans isomerase n=1 Tax=Sunxiuqinia rutila TaxID=1397841 RepID=UPI002630D69F|nr:FKBP-type peptidyl-prolyl cis-trans isomerase [uncultured Sunxiuqinia sp.]
MKKIFLFAVLIGGLMMTIASCKDDGIDLEKLRAEELEKLDAFLEANNIEEEPTASGMYYIERVKGTGDTIKLGDKVKIFYTGMLIDSTEFDRTGTYEPFEFIVGSSDVIVGMSEGLTYMTQGGKATFIIPSNLAYGASSSSSGLPRFSTLIFDVEVYKHYKLSDTQSE